MKRITRSLFGLAAIAAICAATSSVQAQSFRRIATFPVFENTSIETQTVAEIVAASEDGQTLIYTDSANDAIGFVDISDPAAPAPAGVLGVGGEPTSVAVLGPYALVAVNTSQDFVNTSGVLKVVHIGLQTVVRTINLGGQPDCIAVSPDKKYVAVAIENERDEDLGNGEPPQSPPGKVVIVDILGPSFFPIPYLWITRDVNLQGVADLYPNDPEPEYISINNRNIAAVTLQENNHIVLIDLAHKKVFRLLLGFFFKGFNGGQIENDWNAGTVNLAQVDTIENDLIEFNSSLFSVPREPDAVTWINNNYLATADEGDLFGGSRGYTIFHRSGNVAYEAGNEFEHLTGAIGHYPEARSENKGSEPEGILYSRFGSKGYLFVGSERSSVVGVYEVSGNGHEFKQVLPTGVGPEGLLAIPQRNLFVVASEEDSREDTFRSSISIYALADAEPNYPTIASEMKPDGTPIPWGALSALAADLDDAGIMWTGYDSFYAQSRLFAIDLTTPVPMIFEEVILTDGGETVDYDIEGIAARPDSAGGGFWVATEGDDDPDIPNRLLRVDDDGTILDEIQLPASLQDEKTNNGFEGVASVFSGANEFVFVCVQREWDDDPDGLVKIGRYDVNGDSWTFAHYPLDAPTSPNGGWVGLSEITPLGADILLVIERDNQAGADARVKKIYGFGTAGVTFQPHGATLPVLEKFEIRDLIADLEGPAGAIIEKVEGLALTLGFEAWIVTDNDGTDDSNGETQLLNLGNLFDN